MSKAQNNYRYSIILASLCTLLVLLSLLLILHPSLVQHLQHRLFRDKVTSTSWKSDPGPYAKLVNPQRAYNLRELLAEPERFAMQREDTLLLISPLHPWEAKESSAWPLESYNELVFYPPVLTAYQSLKADLEGKFAESLYLQEAYCSKEKAARLHSEHPELYPEPTASEQVSGLAINVEFSGFTATNIINHPPGLWLSENCQDYGFILRYPRGREDITGYTFQPWHYRYVGLPHSQIMYAEAWVLEEYLEKFQPEQFYYFADYFLLRTNQEEFQLPAQSRDLKLSYDNLGYYIIWGKWAHSTTEETSEPGL